ncbi:MAG: hypothetical protein IH623_25315 [Verrucomicrobia bacterium]|nr:hypothetical protein [Verrucomicrobiota bacterium]
MKRRIALIVAVVLPVAFAAVYAFGVFMDCEYVHWPTIWQASRAETPSGYRVADLIRTRASTSPAHPHWHHCGWCETVYSHAKHVAIKVTVSPSEAYLFDWDASTRRLTPLTVRTAEVFPELVPSGFVAEASLDGGLDGQLHDDRPCRLVARR